MVNTLALALATALIPPAQTENSGQLTCVMPDGKPGLLCPLERTSVTANVAGFGARVQVVQKFKNPSKEPIEAVYTFPLPADAAVDGMEFKVGNRVITGSIKRREEARRIYEAAKNAGQNAALLDQERPNIFTQSVANIMPGQTIEVRLSYVEQVTYKDGQFEFMFPMTVGPRFLGNAPDADKIAPPRVKRPGTNIDIQVYVDAGTKITQIGSPLHEIKVQNAAESQRVVNLAKFDEIPNKDFVLRWQTPADSVQSAFLAHKDQRGGFFALNIMPPKAPKISQIAPREVIFVMDQSGSQGGLPIDKSKELTLKLLQNLRPGDTFNVCGFSNNVNWLWPESRPYAGEYKAEAEKFVQSLQANGGTQLNIALNAAMAVPRDLGRTRLVVFNTDGYVGDENEILKSVIKYRDTARIFTFGIGNGVNRYLVDGMASEGRGDSEVVFVGQPKVDDAVERFLRRTESPILTDVKVEIDGVRVFAHDGCPIKDVFDESPISVLGRYERGGPAKVTVSGMLGGRTPWANTYDVNFPDRNDAPAIATLWARREVSNVERTSRMEGQSGEKRIVDLSLEFGIMTQYTSFVAVEERIVNVGGKQRRVAVPVANVDGVSSEFETGGMALGAHRSVGGRPGMSGGLPGGGGGGFGGGSAGAAPATKSADASSERGGGRNATDPATKIAKELKNAKGKLEVIVWLGQVDKDTKDILKRAGLSVDLLDEKLKMAVGTIDAKKLLELAKLGIVENIDPLR